MFFLIVLWNFVFLLILLLLLLLLGLPLQPPLTLWVVTV